jgi:sugar-specific transcriptional regulator TrmB
MFSEQVYQVLVELGLSSLQAKIYCALIQIQDPTATAISKLSKVARQEVYRITDELAEIGLVSRTISTPIRFQPVPLNEALSILMERRIKLTSGLMQKIKVISRESKKKQEKTLSNYVIRELSPNEDWFGNSPLKLETTKTFDLITSFERFSARLKSDQKAFRKAIRTKKTIIRIITDKPPANSPFYKIINSLMKYPYFQIHFLESKPDAVLLIFNKQEAAVSVSLTKTPGPPYLFANHPAFLYLALEHFETMWNMAKKSMIYPPDIMGIDNAGTISQ